MAGSETSAASAVRRISESHGPAPVWIPSPAERSHSQLCDFIQRLSVRFRQRFDSYEALHGWSVAHSADFWRFFAGWSEDVLGFVGNIRSDTQPAVVGAGVEDTRFFPHLRLNYAASLLNDRVAPEQAPALTHCFADGRRARWTRGQLRHEVERAAAGLRSLGLGPGDRVVALMRNDAQAVIAGLAVTATGATLSTASPDMGLDALTDRFAPLSPRMLITHLAITPSEPPPGMRDKVEALAARLPALARVVLLDDGTLDPGSRAECLAFAELMESGGAPFEWPQLAFNHPLFIMFSSGTTGRPKCIVHGAGGTLLEHVKEHRLHTDLGPGDRMYFHTGCGWMMWNWQLSALASGVELVTYDGGISSVDRLWRLVADEAVTVFGTSPAYLRMCEDAGLAPGRQFDLRPLRAVLSTGAVLHDRQFHWVRENVKPLPLQSISGGTDIIGCFVLGNPMLPVFAGHAQCKSLALDVQAWHDGCATGGIGELVCANAFPSRPLGFFGDDDGSRFHAAYFAQNPGVWTHGDLIEFSREAGARLHGRSDDVINVNGIKFAPAEVQRILDAMPQMRESLVTELPAGTHGERQTVALLVLREGQSLDAALAATARREIASRLSAVHVPDRFLQVAELPVTYSGKISSAAVRLALSGQAVGNSDALRNPQSLDPLRAAAATRLSQHASQDADTALTAKLQNSWQRLLGLDAVGLDDNFFELGGTSLIAARLLRDVEKFTGKRLPIGVLMEAPTISKLAELIESGRWSSSAAGIVRLREGLGHPVVMVPGITCTVLDFQRLAYAMRTSRPIYGLEWYGPMDGRPVHERLQAVAAQHVAQLREHLPQRPIALCGYSFGGIVALEIARQLQQAGEQVEAVFVLDSFLQPPVALRFLRLARTVARTRGPELRMYGSRVVRKTSRELMEWLGWLPRRPPVFMSERPLTPDLLPIFEYLFPSYVVYRPARYDGSPIFYIRARQDGFDLMLLWRRVARAGMELLEFDGTHQGLVRDDAEVVAGLIDARLVGQCPGSFLAGRHDRLPIASPGPAK